MNDNDDELKRFIKERNEAVINMDVNYIYNQFPDVKDDHTAILILHKVRLHSLGIPNNFRLASKKWLLEHNYNDLYGLSLTDDNSLPQ